MIESILKNCDISSVMNTQADGTGDTLNSSIVDLQGFDSVCFICKLGDVTDTAVLTLKAYAGDESDVSDGAYKTNNATVTAGATSADDKLLVLDVIKPGSRYVRADLVRATANAVVESIVAIKYNARTKPRTQGSTVIDSEISVN